MNEVKYGKYNGYWKWDLCVEWFSMNNDDFFNKYGFNFNPHNYEGLYSEVRNVVYN